MRPSMVARVKLRIMMMKMIYLVNDDNDDEDNEENVYDDDYGDNNDLSTRQR